MSKAIILLYGGLDSTTVPAYSQREGIRILMERRVENVMPACFEEMVLTMSKWMTQPIINKYLKFNAI